MNKEDLIKYVSDEIGVVQTETAIIVDAVLKGIYKGILENEKVTFKDFGAFQFHTVTVKVEVLSIVAYAYTLFGAFLALAVFSTYSFIAV